MRPSTWLGSVAGKFLLILVVLVAGQAARAARREASELGAKVDAEAARGRAAVERARQRAERARESLATIDAELESAGDADRAKLSARRKRAESASKAAEAKLAEATRAAQPAADAARAVAELQRGNWQRAEGLARAAKAPTLAVEMAYVAALCRYRAGDYATALKELDTPALRSVFDAPRTIGLARYRLHESDKALAELRRARLAPNDVEAHTALAELHLARRELREAVAELQLAVKAAPTDRKLLLQLGRSELELGHAAEAARAFDKLLQGGARDRDVAYLLAAARARLGELQEAERALGRYLKKERSTVGDARYERARQRLFVVPSHGYQAGLPTAPSEEAAQNQLAVWLAERGELEEARRRFDAAPSGDSRALYNRGLVELQAGRLPQAKASLEKAAAAAPERPEAPHALGIVALLGADAAAATAAFTEAQRRAPADELPRLGLAVARQDRAALQALLGKGRPLDAAARVNLAALHFADKDSATAQKVLGSVEGGLPEAALLRGQLAEASGSLDEAGAAYAAAVALQPHYFDALTGLGRVLHKRGDASAARSALERAVAVLPDEPEPHALLAAVLQSLGEGDLAAAEDAKAKRLQAVSGAKVDGKPARVVGVPVFDNTGKLPAHAWLSVGIAEALASDLPKLGGVRVVERAQLQKAFDEARLQQLVGVDAADAPRVGKMVGADALVIGSFQIVGAEIRILGRLVSVENGTVIRAGEASGKLDQLFAIERRLALDLLSDYAGVAGKDKEAFFAQQAPSLDGLAAVAEADVALRRGDRAAAKAALQRAEQADPRFAAAYADLKKSAEATANVAVLPLKNATGRGDDAWLSGGIAESLSGDLRKLGVPQVERLAIDKVLQEKRFAELFGGSGSDGASAAGKQLGAKALVVGSFACEGDRLRIDARLVDVDTQKVLLADSVEGRRQELFTLETDLAMRLGKQLNPTVKESDRAGIESDHGSVAELEQQQRARGGAAGATVTAGAADGQAMQRAVATQLQQTGVLFVPDAARPPPPPPPRTVPVPAQLQSRIVVLGGQGPGERIRLDARLVDRRSGAVLAATSLEGARTELPTLQSQIAAALARQIAALPPARGVR